MSRGSNLMDEYMHQVYLYFPDLLGEVVHAREYVQLMLLLETTTKYDYFYNITNNVLIPIPKSDQDLDKESFARIFGVLLRRALEHSGLTQEELSEKTGIPQARISDYLYGKHFPSFYQIDKMAKAMNCSVEDLRYVK